MGKPTGFLEYDRVTSRAVTPKVRIKDFREFHAPLSGAEQQRQGTRCMECGVPFCQSSMMVRGMMSGCPLNSLIPEWNDLVFRGNWGQAHRRLKETNSFPEFTYRVCPAPCGAACTCGLHEEPVSIEENEVAITERAYAGGIAAANPPGIRTGKKVAIVGSNPAGLAVADQLNKRRHSATVYERPGKIGSLLMYGIPDMKLERHIIEQKTAVVKGEGVTFVTEANIGVDYKAKQVIKEYDGVILACDASNPRDIAIPGGGGEGIHLTVDLLTATTKGLLDSNLEGGKYISAKDKHVMVVGGGDAGNDYVGTAIRHGCASVIQLGIMPKFPGGKAEDDSWPEWPRVCKTDYGQEEATAVFGTDPRIYQTTIKEPKKNKGGRVSPAVIISLALEKEPGSGRTVMVLVGGSEKRIPVDLVLIATGFLGAQAYMAEALNVELNGRTNVATEEHGYRANVERVFTVGDMHRGQSPVIRAIRESRETARGVGEILMGYSSPA